MSTTSKRGLPRALEPASVSYLAAYWDATYWLLLGALGAAVVALAIAALVQWVRR